MLLSWNLGLGLKIFFKTDYDKYGKITKLSFVTVLKCYIKCLIEVTVLQN